MTADGRYRSLLFLFGFIAACTIVSASRWLFNGLIPLWAVCCQFMRGRMGNEMASSPILLAVAMLLVMGLGTLTARLWKTHRFASGLNTSAVAMPPIRLAHILTDLGLAQHTVVLASERPLAFCSGLLRPRICLSTGLADVFTDKELKAVLLHEDHHRRHYDPLRTLMAEVLATTLFFLPIAAELRDLFLTSTELEADQSAAHLAGRPSLAGAMHKLLTHPLAVSLPAPGISGLSASEARVAVLLGDPVAPLRLSSHSLITSSAILMLVCVLA